MARTAVVFPGDVYGRLTVVAEAGRKDSQRAFLCRCACGGSTVVPSGSLRKGNTRSCGCELPTLGGIVGNWVQSHLAIPDGERMGEPYLLTAEQWNFLLHVYRLDAQGRFVYRRGGLLVRPQKHGKGPFSAAIIAAEAAGPTRFAGWDASGEPTGKPTPTPWIQVAAVSEDQTANVWRALLPMLQLGDVAHEIEDVGLTRINLPRGGRIEPVTAAHRSRVGQRTTFAVLDEAGFWLAGNHGRELADAMFRNLAGMIGRFLMTTNAWDPVEESVAQQTSEAGDPGVYVDDVEPGEGSIRNKVERRKMLRKVYGDSAAGCEAQGNASGRIEPWIDLDRIEVEIAALVDRDAAQAERFFLNRKRASESAAFGAEPWDRLADLERIVEPGALIVLGVDGARFADALAIVATEVETGHQWPVGIWERPENAADDYEHPFDEVDGAMLEAFDTFTVWRVHVDPQWVDVLLDRWQGRWGAKTVLPWLTNRPKQISEAVRRFSQALAGGDLSHSGDETLDRHVKNATRQKVNVYDDEHRQLFTISKDRPGSPRKIDAAMAAVLSWEARSDAIAEGAKRKGRGVIFIG